MTPLRCGSGPWPPGLAPPAPGPALEPPSPSVRTKLPAGAIPRSSWPDPEVQAAAAGECACCPPDGDDGVQLPGAAAHSPTHQVEWRVVSFVCTIWKIMQERPTRMPDTRIGTRAGGPDWTVGTYTTGRSTPAPTLFLPPRPVWTRKEGPGLSARGPVSPTRSVASSTPGPRWLTYHPVPRGDTPPADPPGHTGMVRRREDQYRTAAPPHSLLVRTSRAEGRPKARAPGREPPASRRGRPCACGAPAVIK